MTMNRNEKLDKLYAEIPEIECKGLCHTTCGLIPLAPSEEARIVDRIGTVQRQRLIDQALNTKSLTCPLLKDNRCSVYDIRPLICRLYGTVKKMKCQYGCKPKVNYLPERKSRKLLAKLEKIKP